MKTINITVKDPEKLGEHLSSEKNPEIRFRLAFLNALIYSEFDLDYVCQIFHVPHSTAYVWIRVWNKAGYPGMAHPFHVSDRPVGRPPQLDENDLRILKSVLARKDYWTTKEIRQLILDRWGIQLSISQVERMLRQKLKLHYGKPYPHDYRRPKDAEEQLAEKLEEAYNRLYRKGISESDIALGFLDESSPQTTANTVRVWSVGAPTIEKNTTRHKSNTIGFYAINGHSVVASLENSKAESILEFLQQVNTKNAEYQGLIIVLDNFTSHKAGVVIDYARDCEIELVFLPSYSPDLNPIEFIWKSIKRVISLKLIKSLQHMRETIYAAWDELSKTHSFAKRWIEKFVPSILPYSELCG